MVFPDQYNREGMKASKARSTHVGGDISEIFTADTVCDLSSTEAEFERGLARLFVDHCRGAKDKWTVLLTQNYTTGQFVVDAAIMPDSYFDRMQPGRQQQESQDDDGYDDQDERLIGEDDA
jgi:hypothetical protein